MSWIGIGIYCMEGQLKSRFQSLCFKVQHIMMGFLKILRKFFILTGELFLLRYFMFTPPFGFSHSGTSYLPPTFGIFPLRYFIFTPSFGFSPQVLHIHPPPLGFFPWGTSYSPPSFGIFYNNYNCKTPNGCRLTNMA